MSAQDISNGRVVTTGVSAARVPNWLLDGAIAFWDLQDTGAVFADSGPNSWDVPMPPNTARTHDLFPSKIMRGASSTFGTASHVGARIVDEMSVVLIFRSLNLSADVGIFCWSTGLTDCLWGIGCTTGVVPALRDKRHGGGAALVPTGSPSIAVYNIPIIMFGTRSTAGVWRLYLDGVSVYNSPSASAPSIVGDEVIAIGCRNELSFIGLWDRELQPTEVLSLTKRCKPLVSVW